MTNRTLTDSREFDGISKPYGAPPAKRWQDPYPVIIRILRHYHRRLIVLGLFTAVAGAAVGRHLGQRQYRSEGLIRIPYARRGTDPQDQGADVPLDLFEAFLQSQQAVLESRRLAELALLEPSWKAIGQIGSNFTAQDLSDELKVEHTARTDYLMISCTDHKPVIAAAAVQSITSAYTRVFDEQNQEFLKGRLASFLAQEAALNGRLQEIDEKISAAAGSSGAANADRLYEAAVDRVVHLDASLAAVRLSHAEARGQQGQFGRSVQILDSLETQEAELSKLRADAWKQMQTLGEQRLEMDRLRAVREPIAKELNDTEQRIELANLQAGVGGRATVVSTGEIPTSPYVDRHWPFTFGGAALGGLLPAAICTVLGLFTPRYRLWGDAEAELSDDTPLLGVLPDMPQNGADGGADAARCLHQIRVVLQSSTCHPRPDSELRCSPRQACTTYLITSCSAGEGKTSIVAALGLSFAASGSRTLLIDCDLLAQSLTRRLSLQGMDGMKEAMASNKLLKNCARFGNEGNLWILPVGHSTPPDAGALAAERVEWLLKEGRREFDVILIDSGPILGSVEAMTFAPRVDAVIFTLTRHQRRELIDASLSKLRSVNALIAGIVFNRAEAQDFRRSAYYSQYSNHVTAQNGRVASQSTPTVNPRWSGFERLGTLVKAVAISLPRETAPCKSEAIEREPANPLAAVPHELSV